MAKKISLRRAHGLNKDEALERMHRLTDALKSRFGLRVSHSGDTTSVKGKGADGTARCDDTNISIDVKLGLPASLAAKKVEAGINKALDEHFGG